MKSPKIFVTNHRARFSEIDPHQILNNEHYLSYFMDHRMTGLRENLGWDLKTMMTLPIFFVVRSVAIDYKRPVIGDVPFKITSRVLEAKDTDIDVGCEMLAEDGKLHATCRMTVTALDPKSRKPTSWPEDIKNLFFEENNS